MKQFIVIYGQDAVSRLMPFEVTVIVPEPVFPVAEIFTVEPEGTLTVFEKGLDGFLIVVVPAESV